MNPIEERIVWFVLGVFFGAIASWLVSGSRRAKVQPIIAPAELPGTTPATPLALMEMPPVQAETMASSRVIDVGAARAAGFNLKHADDLTVIDGIGPKIEDQLRANGISSFVQIACQSVDDLLDILERGGPSFRFANPESWPLQASLATQNRWKDLKKMQNDRLDNRDATENA